MIAALLAVLLASGPASAADSPAAPRLSVTPEEIRTTPTRELAERLVARVRRECDEAEGGGSGPAPAAGARLVMMVPLDKFPSIARFGFLNEHLTRTAGFDRLAERFEAEQELALARLPYDLHGRELLPKHALLDAPDRGLGRFLLPKRYGEVAVVFKKDVAKRATWTYADSLDFSRRSRDRGGDADPVLPRTFSYRRKRKDANRCVSYCEAQIWGELNLGDVDYLMIPKGAKVPAGAATARLKVYRYSVPKSTSAAGAPERTAVYVRGAEVRVSTAPESLPASADYRAMPDLQGLRASFEEARLTDEEAVKRLAASKDADERLRLTGALAARVKKPVVLDALERELKAAEPGVRAQALYGLSEAPWDRFKPFLLSALRDPDRTVRVEAIALAADRRGDADVDAALAALKADAEARAQDPRDDRALDELEWLSRPDRPRLCGPPGRGARATVRPTGS